MWLEGAGQRGRVRRAVAGRRVEASERVPQRIAASGRPGELRRQLRQQAVRLQIASRALDLVEQQAGQREVLKDRDDVGERFVKRDHVGVARIQHAPMHAVEDGVGHLVRDDVVRQAA